VDIPPGSGRSAYTWPLIYYSRKACLSSLQDESSSIHITINNGFKSDVVLKCLVQHGHMPSNGTSWTPTIRSMNVVHDGQFIDVNIQVVCGPDIEDALCLLGKNIASFIRKNNSTMNSTILEIDQVLHDTRLGLLAKKFAPVGHQMTDIVRACGLYLWDSHYLSSLTVKDSRKALKDFVYKLSVENVEAQSRKDEASEVADRRSDSLRELLNRTQEEVERSSRQLPLGYSF